MDINRAVIASEAWQSQGIGVSHRSSQWLLPNGLHYKHMRGGITVLRAGAWIETL